MTDDAPSEEKRKKRVNGALRAFDRWARDETFALTPPQFMRAPLAEAEAEEQRFVDWASDALDRFAGHYDQQRLELSDEDKRHNVRLAVAHYLETVVHPVVADPLVRKLSTKLREARQNGTWMYNRDTGKFVTLWDTKAGLPLLCPDDAREEGMRLQRRIVPAIMEELKQKGTRVYYACFTMPNAAPGKLRDAMRSLSKKFNSMMRKCKRDMAQGDNTLPFVGAYATMEAPLGWRRDWHPHLNVLLVTRGWFDYADLRKYWFHDVEVDHIEGTQSSIEAALRELIKYPVQTVEGKSLEKAQRAVSQVDPLRVGKQEPDAFKGKSAVDSADGSSPSGSPVWRDTTGNAPPLTQWTAGEFVEWWEAHRKFRRSRGYGCLYNVDKPEPESLEGFVPVGTVKAEGNRLIRRVPLLEFIPGDKSSMTDVREKLRAHLKRLVGDPERHKSALQLMQEAIRTWPTLQK